MSIRGKLTGGKDDKKSDTIRKVFAKDLILFADLKYGIFLDFSFFSFF